MIQPNIFQEFLGDIKKVVNAKAARIIRRRRQWEIETSEAGELMAYKDVLRMLKSDYPDGFYEQYKEWLPPAEEAEA